jgi:hypothetical protein
MDARPTPVGNAADSPGGHDLKQQQLLRERQTWSSTPGRPGAIPHDGVLRRQRDEVPCGDAKRVG